MRIRLRLFFLSALTLFFACDTRRAPADPPAPHGRTEDIALAADFTRVSARVVAGAIALASTNVPPKAATTRSSARDVRRRPVPYRIVSSPAAGPRAWRAPRARASQVCRPARRGPATPQGRQRHRSPTSGRWYGGAPPAGVPRPGGCRRLREKRRYQSQQILQKDSGKRVKAIKHDFSISLKAH